MRISWEDLTAGRPGAPAVRAEDVAGAGCPALIVLDDDPTGTQSVSELPVVTTWQVEDLEWGLSTGAAAVYVMTNSRSLGPADAERVNREAVRNGLEAARRTCRRVAFVSRSDSTLRGHYPLEPDAIAAVLAQHGRRVDGVVLVPAFPEAGRITLDAVHYAGSVADGFVPVGDSEFASDATFGYRSSDLADWVQEKSGGRLAADEVIRIGLGALRTDPEAVVAALAGARDAQPIVVDCLEENDLRLLALGLARAEALGHDFIYRVGPPFVRARIGQPPRVPLGPDACRPAPGAAASDAAGGLVVVGSHVGLTRRQVGALAGRDEIAQLVLDVPRTLDESTRAAHLDEVVAAAVAQLGRGTALVRCSETLVTGADADDSLRIARAVSDAVVEVVRRTLGARAPRFVVAKGGITSSDVASRGLGIRRAIARGPMLPGIISLWEPVDGPARGIPYVVFPGNVGDEGSLADVIDTLQESLR
ncbi:MAG: hypothetical protein E7Z97_09040 [Propionibacteriaceae bacterium]|nr:hypothetical protein [Propionibacteriaceae bacterium]